MGLLNFVKGRRARAKDKAPGGREISSDLPNFGKFKEDSHRRRHSINITDAVVGHRPKSWSRHKDKVFYKRGKRGNFYSRGRRGNIVSRRRR